MCKLFSTGRNLVKGARAEASQEPHRRQQRNASGTTRHLTFLSHLTTQSSLKVFWDRSKFQIIGPESVFRTA